jgi:hypothetical protein
LSGGIALSLEMPWEDERKTRLWRAVWEGMFRHLATPHWQLPTPPDEPEGASERTREILRAWLPPTEGPGAKLRISELARLLDASWLAEEKLFARVLPLRAAATRGRSRLEACRLCVALKLYQLEENKTAQRLDDLVPKYLPQVPVDPYSGQPFRYRISEGERLQVIGDAAQLGPGLGVVQRGQGIVWSTGPDRVDNGGRSHGGAFGDNDPRWLTPELDLITIAPLGP